jgi:hypothetical protein
MVEHLQASMRPWIQAQVTPKKERKKKDLRNQDSSPDHTWNPSIWETEAWGLGVLGQPGLSHLKPATAELQVWILVVTWLSTWWLLLHKRWHFGAVSVTHFNPETEWAVSPVQVPSPWKKSDQSSAHTWSNQFWSRSVVISYQEHYRRGPYLWVGGSCQRRGTKSTALNY